MKKKHAILSLVIVFTVALCFIPLEAYARIPGLDSAINGVRNGIAELLWNVTYVLLNVFLYVLQFVGSLFEAVAGVQNFFSDGVNAAWEATRDFANLFFALMLLFIAIATVLGMNQYSAKNMLPKFFIAALFINFSKALVGVLIDISQIIMFEFYNALGGNITNNAVNFSQITYFHNGVPEANGNQFELYMNGVILNLIMILLIVILIAAFIWGTLTLAIRLVTLWVLISLSPVAFVSMIVPPLSGAFNEWKKSLSEQLVKGPAFMFFVWLAFIVLNATTDTLYTPTNELSGNGLDSSFTTFFTDGGPFIGFTLTAIFLFMANSIAEKAATAAPGVGGKLAGAVGKYGGVATLGIGGYMGLSKVKTFGKGSEGLAQNARSAAMDVGKAGLAVGSVATAGGAALAAGAGLGYLGYKAADAGTNAIPSLKHQKRYFKERVSSNFKDGNLTGGKIPLADRAARMFSEEAQEKAYQKYKDPLEKARVEAPIMSGTDKFDPETYLAYRQAEATAMKELKEIDDVDALHEKIVKSKDVATKRAGLKRLAAVEDGMSEENLDKLGKELGVKFEKGTSRAQKIEKIANQVRFKNPEYHPKDPELDADIARQLRDEGDYTYNPEELAKGAKGEDAVYGYLKNKPVKKRIGALNKRNLAVDGQLKKDRFEKLVNSIDESDLQDRRMLENIPDKKELRQMLEEAYGNSSNMSGNVSIIYNSITGGNNTTKGKTTNTQKNTHGVDPSDMNNPFNTAAVGQTSTGAVDQNELNDDPNNPFK